MNGQPSTVTSLVCAGDKELPDLVDGPDMRDAVSGWSRPMWLRISTLTPDQGGDASEQIRLVQTEGFRRPAKPRKLDIKTSGEGTRHWKYWSIYVLNDPSIKVGDKLEIAGVPYKAIESSDMSQFGFYKFMAVEDFRA